jgi:hypothetical protein
VSQPGSKIPPLLLRSVPRTCFLLNNILVVFFATEPARSESRRGGDVDRQTSVAKAVSALQFFGTTEVVPFQVVPSPRYLMARASHLSLQKPERQGWGGRLITTDYFSIFAIQLLRIG